MFSTLIGLGAAALKLELMYILSAPLCIASESHMTSETKSQYKANTKVINGS